MTCFFSLVCWLRNQAKANSKYFIPMLISQVCRLAVPPEMLAQLLVPLVCLNYLPSSGLFFKGKTAIVLRFFVCSVIWRNT